MSSVNFVAAVTVDRSGGVIHNTSPPKKMENEYENVANSEEALTIVKNFASNSEEFEKMWGDGEGMEYVEQIRLYRTSSELLFVLIGGDEI